MQRKLFHLHVSVELVHDPVVLHSRRMNGIRDVQNLHNEGDVESNADDHADGCDGFAGNEHFQVAAKRSVEQRPNDQVED